MKISFVDNIAECKSFLELCNYIKDYGFDGVEISDVEKEKVIMLGLEVLIEEVN